MSDRVGLSEGRCEGDPARLRNLQKIKHHFDACMGPGMFLAPLPFFVADPLLGSCRAHRRRISGRLHMAALRP